jgi:hypothetical protein
MLVVFMVASTMLRSAMLRRGMPPGKLRLIVGEDGSRSCFAQVGGFCQAVKASGDGGDPCLGTTEVSRQ